MISNSRLVSVNSDNITNTKKNKSNQNPNFKGIGSAIMNGTGWMMSGIENGGFITSFLIQDTIGMTAPRTGRGLYRDREKGTKFKDLNFKEAAEVFIREFFSGVLMMTAPIAIFIATKKFVGKSTFTNTGLLKKMGKNFTEAVKNKNVGDSAKNIKNSFYRNTITEFVENTVPNVKGKAQATEIINKLHGHVTKIDELEPQLKNAKGNKFTDKFLNIFRNKENKVRSEKDLIKEQIKSAKNDFFKDLNDFHTSNSSEFNLVNKVKLNNETYRASDVFDAMRGYASDVARNNDIATLTEDAAKSIETSTMAKRIVSTAAASAGTIASTSIIPSIYAMLNPVPPGALDTGCHNPDHDHMPKQKEQPVKANNTTEAQKSPAFKGLGNALKHLQFDGNQLTPALMMVLAGGGLVYPRVRTAVKRAPVDEDGKKNLIEVPEILARDLTSITTVTFAEPILSKAMVNAYKEKSGFVLTTKPKENMSGFRKVLDALNPFSSIKPYNSKDLKEIYTIDSKAKLMNFAEFINNNDGNLVKVFYKLKNGKKLFAGTVADFDVISKLDKKAANSKIIEVIAEKFTEGSVKEFMEPKKVLKNGKVALNDMYKTARNLNCAPKFLNTIILVPVFLGLVLPKFVYGITAKNRKKMELEKQAKAAQKNVVNNDINNQPNKKIQVTTKPVQKMSKTTFAQMKHTTK